MPLKIRKIGDPVLRKIATSVPVDEIETPSIQALIDDMIETMRSVNGAGLAAPQVGEPLRILMAEVSSNPRYPYKPELPLTIIVNPEIKLLTRETFNNFEGCLSVPDLRGEVQRCPHIKVGGYNRAGQYQETEYRGVTAGTFQHEFDHLEGILFLDRVIDTTTLCTWDEYEKHYAKEFQRIVELTVQKYGS